MGLKVAVLLGVLVICILIKFPVFLSMCTAVITFTLCFPDVMNLEVMGQGLVQGLNNYSYAGVVFFFISGEIMSGGGISHRIIEFFDAAIGHVRGGLSHVNVLESIVFAGVSGSSMADTTATGAIMIPAMVKQGYTPEYATAITIASSSIGPIIPPSTGMILLAVYCGASTVHCLMGGLVPGIFIGIFLLITSLYLSKKRNFPKSDWKGWKNLWKVFSKNILALLLPVIIIILLSTGVVTVNEAGAVCCLYAIIVSCFIYRDLDAKGLLKTLMNAARTSARLLCLLGMAGIFTWITGSIGVRSALNALMEPFIDRPTLLLGLCVLVMLVLGMFMDHSIIMFVIAPMMAPALATAGINMIQFCVVTMVACGMGLITPPVGMLIYIGSSIGKADPIGVVKELVPFLIALFALLVVLILFPAITTTLPTLLYGN